MIAFHPIISISNKINAALQNTSKAKFFLVIVRRHQVLVVHPPRTTKRYAKVLFFDVRRAGNLITGKTSDKGEFFVCCFEVI
jgi:hypothetical protein